MNKSTSFDVWARYFVWNFKGTLWNSTQNILPIHWKIWILCSIELLRALRFKSSYVFLKRPPDLWCVCVVSTFLTKGVCEPYRCQSSRKTGGAGGAYGVVCPNKNILGACVLENALSRVNKATRYMPIKTTNEFLDTVEFLYNPRMRLQNSRKRHSIPRPWGPGVEWPCLVG